MEACSFTGHRTIESRHYGKIDNLLDRAIAYAYAEGCRRFYVGGAIGFDTLAARRIIFFRMTHPDAELHVVAPCKNQCDGWSEAQIGMWEQGALGSSPEASSVASPGWGIWNRALAGRAGRERGHSQLYFQHGETAWG